MMPLVQLGAFREARWSVQRVAEVFSITDYTGDGVDGRLLSLNMDLSLGGMVMIARTDGLISNISVVDTVRGPGLTLNTRDSAAEQTLTAGVQSFTTAGIKLGSADGMNGASGPYKAFAFKKRRRFFDIVTWTGDGTTNRRIGHSLGATPGMIWVRGRSPGNNWIIGHRGLSLGSEFVYMNNAPVATGDDTILAMDETGFNVGSALTVNGGGQTFVAFIFAHDVSGDSAIQCGSYIGNGSPTGPNVVLGWEPQVVLIKALGPSSSGGTWLLLPNPAAGSTDDEINLNEGGFLRNVFDWIDPTPTGFQPKANHPYVNYLGDRYIYMAIRKAYGGLPNIVTPTAGGGALDYSDPQNSLYPHLF